MSQIEIRKVETKCDREAFVQLHYDLYRGCKYDAPNLRMDEHGNFDEQKNPAFEFCEACRFLALKDGKVVGRVAGIINRRANEKWQADQVRFGWLDMIDDVDVTRALLDAVEAWGKAKGMKEIVGPLGFTDMDPEGMLTEGFDQLGTQATIYNHEYYPRHIEQLGGWEKDNDYVEWKIYIPEKIPERMQKIADMIEERYNLHVKKCTLKDVYQGGYGIKMFDVINKTFKDLYGYSEMTERQIIQYIKMYMPMVDLNLITLVEDWNTPNHDVIGSAITIPSMTKALQKCKNGRLFPFGWWHILKALKFHKTEAVDLLLIGVLPEYRKKGANALIFCDLIKWYQRYGFKWGESHVEMETNMKVQNQWSFFDSELHKRRRCYKKSLQ